MTDVENFERERHPVQRFFDTTAEYAEALVDETVLGQQEAREFEQDGFGHIRYRFQARSGRDTYLSLSARSDPDRPYHEIGWGDATFTGEMRLFRDAADNIIPVYLSGSGTVIHTPDLGHQEHLLSIGYSRISHTPDWFMLLEPTVIDEAYLSRRDWRPDYVTEMRKRVQDAIDQGVTHRDALDSADAVRRLNTEAMATLVEHLSYTLDEFAFTTGVQSMTKWAHSRDTDE